jgi:hypothetical protein
MRSIRDYPLVSRIDTRIDSSISCIVDTGAIWTSQDARSAGGCGIHLARRGNRSLQLLLQERQKGKGKYTHLGPEETHQVCPVLFGVSCLAKRHCLRSYSKHDFAGCWRCRSHL